MSNLKICNYSQLKIPKTWLTEVPKSWLLHFLLIFPFPPWDYTRSLKKQFSLKRHKLCVLPLKLCIKYLNDLHFAHSSILRTRGDHNISWSIHNLSISSQGDTNWIDDIIQLVTSGNDACLKIYNIYKQPRHASHVMIIATHTPIERWQDHANKAQCLITPRLRRISLGAPRETTF
jgi:hypothetical protein